MVGLDEDIKKMPMGMYTVISDGASTFSGGAAPTHHDRARDCSPPAYSVL